MMPMAKVRAEKRDREPQGRQPGGAYEKSFTLQSTDINYIDDPKRRQSDTVEAVGSPTNSNNSKSKERTLDKAKSFN